MSSSYCFARLSISFFHFFTHSAVIRHSIQLQVPRESSCWILHKVFDFTRPQQLLSIASLEAAVENLYCKTNIIF